MPTYLPEALEALLGVPIAMALFAIWFVGLRAFLRAAYPPSKETD